MKKTMLLVLSWILALSLAACGEPDASVTPTHSATNPTTSPTTTAPHVHSFGQWIVSTEPTCSNPGEEIRSCDCGVEESRQIAVKDHDYVETDSKEPTPSDPIGSITYTCAVCCETYTEQVESYGSEGLVYVVLTQDMWDSPDNNGTMCSIVAMGTCTDTELVIPKYIDGYKVVQIGKQAFYDCDTITSVVLPDSILFIGESAFEKCGKLKSVAMQDGVVVISDLAFHWCLQLTKINIPNTVQTIGVQAFRGVAADSVVIPDSVTYIGEMAFESCDMVSVTLSKNITVLKEKVFNFCLNLTSIEIPDGVTEIGVFAFYNCEDLTSITIPDSVTFIADGAFRECSKLTQIYFMGTMEQWNAIQKGSGNSQWAWDDHTGYYTVYCTDGEIQKVVS